MPRSGRFLPGSSDCYGAFPLLRWTHLGPCHVARASNNRLSAWPGCIETACGENLLVTQHEDQDNSKMNYSLVRLVWQNTEELISRPFLDENSIRQLFWDRVNPWPATGGLALLQLQLCLQLQKNTMVPVDVDGQICHFCSQVFVPCHSCRIEFSSKNGREISSSVFGTTRWPQL